TRDRPSGRRARRVPSAIPTSRPARWWRSWFPAIRDTPVEFGVTAYAACNGLGRTTEEVLEGLRQGRRGLRPCPLDVPFDVPCGVVPGELPDLPSTLEPFASRQLRIAWLGITDLLPSLERAVAQHGPSRVGLVLGTSTGGL